MFSEWKNNLVYPRPLPSRGTIGVVAPASPVDREKLNRGVHYLENLGYQVKTGETCSASNYYVAGEDAFRASELMDFFNDSSVDAIFCARGGYGTLRILPYLDFEQIRQSQKLLVGFSDITALQWAILAKSGLVTISGGMVATDMARSSLNDEFESHFWKFIETGEFSYELDHARKQESTIEGHALPGTASVASTLIGSSYLPLPEEKCLFPILEDVNEQTHKIESHLLQFTNCSLFDKSRAVMLGYFRPSETEEYDEVPPREKLFDYIFQSFNGPVIKNVPYGHMPGKFPFPVGAKLSLSLGSETILETQGSIFKH